MEMQETQGDLKKYWESLRKELEQQQKEYDYIGSQMRRTQEEIWRMEELLGIGD